MRLVRPWTPEETALLIKQYPSMSTCDLSTLLGRSRVSIQRKANRLGLRSRRTLSTTSIRHEYFSYIDTPLKAYILGLLASDGYVDAKHQIRLVLNRKDASLVHLVRDELAPLAPIHAKGSVVIFRIVSQIMASDLAAYGVVAGKSYSLSWPRCLPLELEHAFLLGYFDGDGSLTMRRTKYGKTHPEWSLYGLQEFLAAASSAIERHTGVRVGKPRPDRRKVALHRISAYGEKARRIDAWLHKDGLGLERKRIPLL